ncbi:hypothetical protein G8O24_03165 [Bradyrhizobium sp. INPA01-394B]|uniref:Uncharacterized protein n=1 Tax=Bradyrhizobium campsiandrae TaxID=1729892 RepID=A0ABR7U9P7_9BRAD|nr:hypothetical protein [Bradyrhizobium campsiandrae]MBC9876345.1 hypothetical protein [Bradyrhizobium campsiandrae]MBC9980132.1 hypothetical protein [Bradyrhizobium campsiandrae]
MNAIRWKQKLQHAHADKHKQYGVVATARRSISPHPPRHDIKTRRPNNEEETNV